MITLKDNQGKRLKGVKLSVNFGNGAKKYTTDKNGQVKINVKSLVPKTYTVKIALANSNYKGTAISTKAVVKKATPKLMAKAKSFKVNDKTKKYTVTLKNNINQVMKNTRLTLKVNGITYVAKTNAKGQATFTINKLTKKGSFNAVLNYAKNKYYNGISKNVKITVN